MGRKRVCVYDDEGEGKYALTRIKENLDGMLPERLDADVEFNYSGTIGGYELCINFSDEGSTPEVVKKWLNRYKEDINNMARNVDNLYDNIEDMLEE